MVHSTDDRCPSCGARSIPIVYGYPLPETFEAADRGEVVLGGCCIRDVDSAFTCGCDQELFPNPEVPG